MALSASIGDAGGTAASERLLGIPFIRAIGMSAVNCTRGKAQSVIGFRSAFAASLGDDKFCEGIIAAVVDQAGSVAIWSKAGLTFPHATVSLNLTFVAPARCNSLLFDAIVLADEGGLGQTSVTVLQPDGRAIALASVAFAMGSYPGDAGLSTTQPYKDAATVGGLPILTIAGHDVTSALGIEQETPLDYCLPFRVNLAGSRDPLALHGGVIAAAGVVCARAALAPLDDLRLIQLSVDYLRSGLPEAACLRPRVISRTRRTALVEVDVWQVDGTRHVARIRARFYAGQVP